MAYHPEVQHAIADMVLELESMVPHLECIASEWSSAVDHGAAWPAKLVALKHHAAEAAKRVVDLAFDVTGGTSMFRTSELERLYRDVRCGGFHPANTFLVHEIVGKTGLGVDLAAEPRWG
jgi:alkylation response protein AidB-like acyl-CoA dehydrogenase